MGESEPIIRVEGLGKKYLLSHQPEGGGRYQSLRDALMNGLRAAARRLVRPWAPTQRPGREEFWALKDVSFEVKRGEVMGIIGRNGAGKSTLLKVLSRVTEPTAGRVILHGRVASLLEVGTGFHPELTGRENVYLNGAILGMGRAEIRKKFDEIVAFAEVEEFLDTPVKRYSSGMYMRLAFAVAAHLEPEILVVDEVLAVGDAQFQKKCIGKMRDVGRHGRTVLFVSHNMNAVVNLTSKAILIDRGRVTANGYTQEVVRQYLMTDNMLTPEWVRPAAGFADGDVVLTAVRCVNKAGQVVGRLDADAGFAVEIDFLVRNKQDVQIAFRLNADADSGTVFTSALPDRLGQCALRMEPGRYRSRCHIPAHLLVPGAYYLLVAANNPKGPQFDLVEQVLKFEITAIGSLTAMEGRLGVVAPLLPWDLHPEGLIHRQLISGE